MKSLSKTRYVLGTKCLKALWLGEHHPDVADTLDTTIKERLKSGTAIGKLAQKLFPNGVEVTEKSYQLDKAVITTQELVTKGTLAIFEAIAFKDRLISRADLLVRESISSPWGIYEVKSTSSVKPEHYEDVAFQTYCFKLCGFNIESTNVVILNGEYIRHGDLNINQLFKIVPVDVSSQLKDIDKKINGCLNVMGDVPCPDIKSGSHCKKSYKCAYFGYCNKHPEYSVYNLPRFSDKQARELSDMGVELIEDIPCTYILTDLQDPHASAVKTDEAIIDYVSIKKYLNTLVEPKSFLDFEGFYPGIPPLDFTKPYSQTPFQFSLRKPNGNISFIPEHNKDPRRELIEYLLQELPESGSIIVWNANYEIGVLKNLAIVFPEYANRISPIINRIWDLMRPFERSLYAHKDFMGKHSLKKVLPILTDLSYESLEIKNGETAGYLYEQWVAGKMSPEDWENKRKDLIVYCGMDTLAMVEILKVLHNLIK